MRAYLTIRDQPAYRRDAFEAGLRAVGFELSNVIPRQPAVDDVLVIWNRYAGHDETAKRFERAGARVLVVENGYLGREWRGDYWYAISQNRHNGAGQWPQGGPERWDSWGVDLAPWREKGEHVLILLQRGIGVPPVAQPADWERRVRGMLATNRPVRLRGHPGEKRPHDTLYDDLRGAWCAITWGSGAALKALAAGVPVFYGFDQWIGADAARAFTGDVSEPFTGDRLPMFRRLAWAMWRLDEIERGLPFRELLC